MDVQGQTSKLDLDSLNDLRWSLFLYHRYLDRYRQGQHTIATPRSQGQCQGHEGHFRFLAVFTRFRELLLQF